MRGRLFQALGLSVVAIAVIITCAPNTPATVQFLTPITGISAPADWPACAPALKTVAEMPPNFAPNFPLPTGLVLFKSLSLQNNLNHRQIVGYAPLDLQGSIQMLHERLGAAGYAVTYTDSEPDETEGVFNGHGWSGNYWVKPILGCPSMTEWVVIAKQS